MFNNCLEVNSFCRENGIKMIDFMVTDFGGRWRRLTIPVDRLTEQTMTSGFGFDGSNYGFVPMEKSDMVLIPDLSSAYVNTLAAIPSLTLIGEVSAIDLPDLRRFEHDPRYVAHKAQEYLKKTGLADEMRVGPEFEFHVFDQVSYAVSPNESRYRVDSRQAEWNTGAEGGNLGYKITRKGGYHLPPPMDLLGDFRDQASLLLEEQGVLVKYHHHEAGGPSQVEIEIEFGPMLEIADKTMMAKHLLRNLAWAEGRSVTFMPKPLPGEAGNGLHLHLHLFKNGRPLFYDQGGYSQLSQTALYFIGGLLAHIGSLCALTNPSTNSYKRLVPGYAAPVNVGFATANRSAVIRIPAYARAPEEKRIELRTPDCTCNIYYALAAVLMAGLDGIEKKIDPQKAGYGPFDHNLFQLTDEERERIKGLPRCLEEALDALEADHQYLTVGEVFPPALIDLWVKNKRAEAASYNQLPQPIEYERYYDF